MIITLCKVKKIIGHNLPHLIVKHVLCFLSVDTPLTQPKLNVSGLTLYQGEEATLGCSIDSLENPAITWSWTCGTQGVYKRLQRNGRTTNVVITAEPTLNGKSCYCTASSYNGFLTVSKSALVTVYCELYLYYRKYLCFEIR